MNANFEVLKFDKKNIPSTCNYEGKIITGAKWKDKRGLNYMIISGFDKGDFFSETWESKLFAYTYQINDGETKLAWKIKDFNPNVFSAVQLATQSVSVADIDKDGIGEPTFFYSIEPDGLDPVTLKLMCFYKNKKAAIRGQLPRVEEEFPSRYEKKIGVETKALPSIITDYMSKLWDDFVLDYKKENFGATTGSVQHENFLEFVDLFPKLALPFLISNTETKLFERNKTIAEHLTKTYICDQEISQLLCVATEKDTESEELNILNHFYPVGKVKLDDGWVLVYQLVYLGYYENILATYQNDGTLVSRINFSGTASDYMTRDGEVKSNLSIAIEVFEYKYGKKRYAENITNSSIKTYTIDRNLQLRDVKGNIIKDEI